MNETTSFNRKAFFESTVALVATAVIAALVAQDGRVPSVFTSFFFLPILFVAYRHPLGFALLVAGVASLASSPAMAVLGTQMNDSVMPVLWLGWPAVYLFLAVTLNQWASIRVQRERLDETERDVLDLKARNEKRQNELETLSQIHNVILAGDEEKALLEEITRRVADLVGAKICVIIVPTSSGHGERPLVSYGYTVEEFSRMFPDGAPYGEGVAGWAILHGRPATSRNVLEDPRYDRLREFARATGFVSAAAAPFEFDKGVTAALVTCYTEERDFSGEEIVRLERLARQAELAIRSARQRESLARFAFETAIALTEAIESRDPYTGGHCQRLADHAMLAASKLALPPREIEVVRLGAALHDVGKVVVPDSVLKKPGKLTPDEFAIVKQHCYSGGQICKRVPFLHDVYPIVYHHHERWDGTGYPDGLRGERIPLGARIVSVVDAYDAMTTERPYREPLAQQAAVEILMDGAGHQWDATVVKTFLEAVSVEADSPEPEHSHT